MANGTFGTLAPVYGFQQKLSATEISLLFAVTAILGAIAQIPAGRLSDKIDRRLVIVALSGGACVVGFLTVLINPNIDILWLMFGLFALYGLCAYPLYAIAVAHANDFAREGEFGRVAGGMLLILGTGLAIGPIIGSWVMNTIAPVGLFIVTATFHGALAVTAFLRMRIRPVREGGRVRFRVMSAEKPISPGTVALDPRTEEVAQEDLPRSAPAHPAAPPAPPAGETEIIVPDAVEPVVVVEAAAEAPKPVDAEPPVIDGTAEVVVEEPPAAPAETPPRPDSKPKAKN
jgi:MFS family permease